PASVVYTSGYSGGADSWLAERARRTPQREPMSVYEVHLGSWRPGLSYRELADELTGYVESMGFTHVELLPVAEHPFGGSWGYQVSGYFAPTARHGHPDEFKALVDEMHQRGIGVILDWVPAHFPKDAHALARFDGSALYEHEDPRLGAHPDWGTLVFNYGRNEVRNFLLASALFWLDQYHVDGLRVDAVASMLYRDYSPKPGECIPNKYGGRENEEAIAFLKEVNERVRDLHPGAVMIAEESTAFPKVTQRAQDGGLSFHYKWSLGWMHDTLDYFAKDPVHRKWHHNGLTFGLVYIFSEQFFLPLSHDEVVDGDGRGFQGLQADAADANVYAFVRWSEDRKRHAVCVANLSPVPHYGYRVGMPQTGSYKELINSDAAAYGGSGVTNPERIAVEAVPWDGQEQSAQLTLPPLGTVWLLPGKE